ncbi:acyl-CoA carboxylase subunit epsilon [Streptomyces sp. NPDC014995]|uniref:acyl-CoA carboxylase subunit epsilon n=1 Tax=Streptomyces sp. NPDC014995 TaxID=3364936 RepID=UPI003700A98B
MNESARKRHGPAPADGAGALIGVVRGCPTAEELAAVVTVLLARQEPGSSAPVPARGAAAGWRRLERAAGHPSPRSWQSPADA